MTGLEIIGAIGAVASVGAGVVGAMGSMQQAQASSAAQNSAAQAADYNQQVANRNAEIARAQASAEAADQATQNRRQLSQIRAAYGASGLDMAGSPLDVLTDTASEQSLDVRRTVYKGELRALDLKDKSTQFGMEAASERRAASTALSAGPINAAGSLLRAGTSLLSIPGAGSSIATRLKAA